jgi:Ca2+-binding RTX toxin-like protein
MKIVVDERSVTDLSKVWLYGMVPHEATVNTFSSGSGPEVHATYVSIGMARGAQPIPVFLTSGFEAHTFTADSRTPYGLQSSPTATNIFDVYHYRKLSGVFPASPDPHDYFPSSYTALPSGHWSPHDYSVDYASYLAAVKTWANALNSSLITSIFYPDVNVTLSFDTPSPLSAVSASFLTSDFEFYMPHVAGDISGTPGNNDTFNYVIDGFDSFHVNTHQRIFGDYSTSGAGGFDVVNLPGSPTDYDIDVQYAPFDSVTFDDTTTTISQRAGRHVSIDLYGIEKVWFSSGIQNAVALTRGVASEMLQLASEVYGSEPPMHWHQPLPQDWVFHYPNADVATAAATRGWHPVSAIELGIVPFPSTRAKPYSLVDGVYSAYDTTDGLAFGFDYSEANALVLTGVVNGKRTLAIAFRGTDQYADFVDYPDFDDHYEKFAPLVEAIRAYVNDAGNGIQQVLVSGHSLGAAMAQHFMADFPADARFSAYTVGSPGADNSLTPDDPRINNFINVHDPIPYATLATDPVVQATFADLIRSTFPVVGSAVSAGLSAIQQKVRVGSDIAIENSRTSGFSLDAHDNAQYAADVLFVVNDAGTLDPSPFRSSPLAAALRAGIPYTGPDVRVAVGTTGNDSLRASVSADYVLAGSGEDVIGAGHGTSSSKTARYIDGGNGSDTVDYSEAGTGLIADLDNPLLNMGAASGDFYSSVESLTGTLFGDRLVGDGNGNRLSGLAGADNLFGGGGDDILTGGAGIDNVDGGDGIDIAIFSGLRTAYTITAMGNGVQVTGPDGTDLLVKIEFAKFEDQNINILGGADTEMISNADGSYAFHRVDALNAQPYTDYFIYYDALGRVTSQVTNNDDGSHINQVWDVQSQNEWVNYYITYDSQNHIVGQVNQNDDSSYIVLKWDVANEQDWADYYVTYDGQNAPIAQVTHNDDGSRIVFKWDRDGQQEWSDYRVTYDNQDRPIGQVTNNDDGSRIVFKWDLDNQFSWTDYRVTDKQGRSLSQVTNNDDGTHVTYGWDANNQASWSDYAVTTDSQNRATEQTTHYDDGTYTVASWDVQNQFNWASSVDYYDALGQHMQQRGVYDDGTPWVV